MKYRKKPVVIDAWTAMELWLAARDNWKLMPPPVSEAYERGGWVFGDDHITIPTLEGNYRADLGDMVIMGVKGEFYPCKADIFAATYERAQE